MAGKVFLTSINLANNSLQNAKIDARWSSTPSGSTNPDAQGSAAEGQLSSYNGVLYIYKTSGGWTPVGGVNGGTLSSNLTLFQGTTSSSPLKFQIGASLATPAQGAMEFDGTNLFFTPVANRKTIAFTDSSISGNAATATKFASNTTGTINGSNYDGSSPIIIKASTTYTLGVTNTNLAFSSGTTWDGGTTGITIGLSATPTGITSINGISVTGSSGSFLTSASTASVLTSVGTLNGLSVALSQTITMGSNRVTNVGTPILDSDAATKKYVDDAVQGLNVHDAVAVASTTSITGTYTPGGGTATTVSGNSGANTLTVTSPGFNIAIGQQVAGTGLSGTVYVTNVTVSGTYTVTLSSNLSSNASGSYTFLGADGGTGVGATFVGTAANLGVIDSYTLLAGDRVLLKDQSTNTQNGIYVVTTVSTNITLTRADDANNSIAKEITAGDFVYVSGPASGGTNKGKSFVQGTTGTATGGGVKIGTDNIAYSQFSATSSVPYASTSTAGIASFSSTYFSVDATGAVSINPNTGGNGTPKTDGVTLKKASTITGNGSQASWSINHGLGQWVHAQLFDSSGNLVEVDIQNTGTNNGTTIFTFANAVTNTTVYNYVIIG